MIGIYRIQSKIKPERIYIGSSINIKRRWVTHLCDLKHNRHNPKLQRHFNKYGESDLLFSILIECGKEILIDNEQKFIDNYKPYFNSSPTAQNTTGFKHTKESKLKISKAGIGNKYTLGIKPWNKGLSGYKTKPATEERKLKASRNNKGKQVGNKHPNFGKHRSKETKRKISEIKKGHLVSTETREKIRTKLIGTKLSEETRIKISKGVKKYYENISVCSTT